MKRKLWMALAIVVLLLVGTLLYVRQFKPVTVYIPAEELDRQGQVSGLTDCFWFAVVSEKSGANYAYPDTGANYWITQFKIPTGAHIEFNAEFPHGRHMSFNTYDDLGQPVDRLNDVMIKPQEGHRNPFMPQGNRTVKERSYSFQIAPNSVQAGAPMAERDKSRPTNTLYAPAEDKAVQLVYRVYVPDTGLTPKAGVALPIPTLVMADGKKLQGEELCKAIVIKEKSMRDIHLTREAAKTLLSLQSQTSPYHPAQPQPEWVAFQNAQRTFAILLKGTAMEWITKYFSTERRGGFYSTIDNTYLTAYVDSRLGETVVIEAKAPTTPKTLKGNAVMETGQLRYWSFCKYRSLFDTAMESCVYDEQVPLTAEGKYTIVFSKPALRPSNAREECGVVWRDWGIGDGIDNPHGGMIVLRHMMPADDFQQSGFATKGNGDEEAVLGPYYPRSQYVQKAEFEKRGCPVRH